MTSPGSPSGQNFNDNYSHAQNTQANSGGDIIDIASFPQKIDGVSFLSESNPAGGDTLDVDVTVDGVSILNGGTPFAIDDTFITVDEINIPVNDTLTDINVGDLIRCDRSNSNGAGLSQNLINVYKNEGSERQNRAAPTGYDQRQEFLFDIRLTNGQSISQPLQKYGLLDQTALIAQLILEQALDAGDTATVGIFIDGLDLVGAFAVDDTTLAGAVINMPIVVAGPNQILAGRPVIGQVVFAAGTTGFTRFSFRLIGD